MSIATPPPYKWSKASKTFHWNYLCCVDIKVHNNVKTHELWLAQLNPSELYNTERTLCDNPQTGGGHTHIQSPEGRILALLNFLHKTYPPNDE